MIHGRGSPHHSGMRAFLVKQVNSAGDVERLTSLERQQLTSAGAATLDVRSLEAVIAWCRREQLGWHLLRFEGPPGVTVWEAWLLANGDDGVFFEPGAAQHCGIGVSQTFVQDLEHRRDVLVEQLQHALDDFEPPRFESWRRES